MARRGIDNLDRAILRYLREDARTPVTGPTGIAEKLKLSPTACRVRVSKLEKLGYIAKYTILINGRNTRFLAFQYVKIKLKDNSDDRIKEMSGFLCSKQSLVTLELIQGDFDLLAKFGLFNLGDFDLMLDELRVQPNCGPTESIYCYKMIKDYQIDIDQVV